MTVERMKEAAKLAKALLDFEKDGFYGWNAYKPVVQVRHEALLIAFPDIEIKRRDAAGEYEYTASVEIDGVTFFCLMDQEELDGLGRQ